MLKMPAYKWVLYCQVTWPKRVAIEAAHADLLYKVRWVGGAMVGMTTFGESAPGGDLLKHFGFLP